jgi:hypothetical protein
MKHLHRYRSFFCYVIYPPSPPITTARRLLGYRPIVDKDTALQVPVCALDGILKFSHRISPRRPRCGG